MRIPAVSALVVFCASVIPAHGEIIDGYSSARHDRFVASTFPGGAPPSPNPTFFLPPETYDFSGVGWVPAPNFVGTRQVTLVSPEDFVCASQSPPAVNSAVVFRANDGSHVARTVVSLTQVANSDVMVGRLSSPVLQGPNGVNYYPIAVGPSSGFLGRTLLMFGQHAQVGRNVLSFFDTVDVGTGPTRVAGNYYEPIFSDGYGYVSPTPPMDEFIVTDGDFGSPTFLFINNQLTLLGTHTVQFHLPGMIASGTGDAFLGDYVDAIAIVTGQSIGTVAVPEPSSLVFMAFAAGAAIVRRRRCRDWAH